MIIFIFIFVIFFKSLCEWTFNSDCKLIYSFAEKQTALTPGEPVEFMFFVISDFKVCFGVSFTCHFVNRLEELFGLINTN